MLINGKDITITAEQNLILVRDSYLELSDTPLQIGFQKELGVAPTMFDTKSRYFTWNPNTILTIVTGLGWEIYWLKSSAKTVTAFSHSDIQTINQSLVKTFRYGADDEVTFFNKQQQFPILSRVGSTVSPAQVQHLVMTDSIVFDGTFYFELPVKDSSISTSKITVLADSNSGTIYGTAGDNYIHTLRTQSSNPGNFLFLFYPGNVPTVPQADSLKYGYSKYTYSETLDWTASDVQVRYIKDVTRDEGYVIYRSALMPNKVSDYEDRQNLIIGGSKNYSDETVTLGQFTLFEYEYRENDYDNNTSIRLIAKPALMDGTPVLYCEIIENGTEYNTIIYPTFVNQTV